MKTTIKTALLTFVITMSITGAKAQKTSTPPLKTTVATYDSALAYSEISWLYFTNDKDKKVIQFQVPDPNTHRNYYNEFWRAAPNKTDVMDGTEWHTSGQAGKKYEIIYVTKKIEGEGGMMDVNVIKDYEKYDSVYVVFKDKYAKWKTDMGKYEAQNKVSNPASIGKKFIDLGKKGDFNGMKQLAESKEANDKRQDDHGIWRQLGRCEKIAKENTPEGAKNEIAKIYLKQFDGEKNKVLQTPVVHYIDQSNAIVTVSVNYKRMYCLYMEKIGGAWKIISADDKIYIQDSMERMFIERSMLKRAKELNPE